MNNIAITRRSGRGNHSSNYQLEEIKAHVSIVEDAPLTESATGEQNQLKSKIDDLSKRYGRNFTIYFSDISRFTRTGEIPEDIYKCLRDRNIDVIAINTKEAGNLLNIMKPENKALVERELHLAQKYNYLRANQTAAARQATKKPDPTIEEVIISLYREEVSKNKIVKLLKHSKRFVDKVINNYQAKLATAMELSPITEDEVELDIDLDLDDDDFDFDNWDIFGDDSDTQESDYWMFNESDALKRRDKIREERDAHKAAVEQALERVSLF